MTGASRYRLTLTPPGAGMAHAVEIERGGAPITIGAGPGATVSVGTKDPELAPVHVRLSVTDRGLEVFKEAASGFIVNGRKCLRAALHDGDRLQLGASAFKIGVAELAGGGIVAVLGGPEPPGTKSACSPPPPAAEAAGSASGSGRHSPPGAPAIVLGGPKPPPPPDASTREIHDESTRGPLRADGRGAAAEPPGGRRPPPTEGGSPESTPPEGYAPMFGTPKRGSALEASVGGSSGMHAQPSARGWGAPPAGTADGWTDDPLARLGGGAAPKGPAPGFVHAPPAPPAEPRPEQRGGLPPHHGPRAIDGGPTVFGGALAGEDVLYLLLWLESRAKSGSFAVHAAAPGGTRHMGRLELRQGAVVGSRAISLGDPALAWVLALAPLPVVEFRFVAGDPPPRQDEVTALLSDLLASAVEQPAE